MHLPIHQNHPYVPDKSQFWIILILISSYNLYTRYFESLTIGRGLIGRVKQITVVSQISYLGIASLFIFLGYGLIAIVSAQLISVIVSRISLYIIFFDKNTKEKLKLIISYNKNSIIKAIYPNAIKMGLTSIGGFLVSRSSIFSILVESFNSALDWGPMTSKEL